MDARTTWEALEPDAPPTLAWIRPVAERRVVLLLGAFDPPTLAHVAVLRAAASHTRWPGAFCLTKVLLDRDRPPLLDPLRRIELLESIADDHGWGVAACNRGAYVDVADAAGADGIQVAFVVGSDKLPQLEDPRFYPDGPAGVTRTFSRARFIVVPRGTPVTREGVETLALDDPDVASISATAVRERLRRGQAVDAQVPHVVAVALRDYTGLADGTRSG